MLKFIWWHTKNGKRLEKYKVLQKWKRKCQHKIKIMKTFYFEATVCCIINKCIIVPPIGDRTWRRRNVTGTHKNLIESEVSSSLNTEMKNKKKAIIKAKRYFLVNGQAEFGTEPGQDRQAFSIQGIPVLVTTHIHTHRRHKENNH